MARPLVFLKAGGVLQIEEVIPEWGEVEDAWVHIEVATGSRHDDGWQVAKPFPRGKVVKAEDQGHPVGPFFVKEPLVEPVQLATMGRAEGYLGCQFCRG